MRDPKLLLDGNEPEVLLEGEARCGWISPPPRTDTDEEALRAYQAQRDQAIVAGVVAFLAGGQGGQWAGLTTAELEAEMDRLDDQIEGIDAELDARCRATHDLEAQRDGARGRRQDLEVEFFRRQGRPARPSEPTWSMRLGKLKESLAKGAARGLRPFGAVLDMPRSDSRPAISILSCGCHVRPALPIGSAYAHGHDGEEGVRVCQVVSVYEQPPCPHGHDATRFCGFCDHVEDGRAVRRGPPVEMSCGYNHPILLPGPDAPPGCVGVVAAKDVRVGEAVFVPTHVSINLDGSAVPTNAVLREAVLAALKGARR